MRMQTPSYYVLLLGLCAGLLWGALPALGQTPRDDEAKTARLDSIEARMIQKLYPHRVNDDFRIGAWIGMCASARGSAEHCHRFQVDVRYMFSPPGGQGGRHSGSRGFQAGSLQPFKKDYPPAAAGAGVQISGIYGLDDNWPDPEPPPDPPPAALAKTSQERVTQISANHSGTLTTTLDLLLVVPLQDKFLLEPFLGIGMTQIFEGDERTATSVAIEGKSMIPTASYGLGVAMRVRSNLDLRLQYRESVYRVGSLTYLLRDERRIDREVGTLSTSHLFFGFALRIPR